MSDIRVLVPRFEVSESVKLPAKKTALIVVDMQNDFVNPKGSLYVSGSEKIIPVIKSLVGRAREKGVMIVFTQDSHMSDDVEFSIWPRHAVEGTWGWSIVDDLKPKDGDVVIRKLRYDAFFGTPLDHILRIRGVEYLVICGVVANICVLHTAGSAALNGYKIVFPMDATVALNEFDYYVAIRQVSFLYKGIITRADGIVFED